MLQQQLLPRKRVSDGRRERIGHHSHRNNNPGIEKREERGQERNGTKTVQKAREKGSMSDPEKVH